VSIISVDDILKETTIPVIAIDENGLITFVNKAFESAFGWNNEKLNGEVVTNIMPPHMRDAHNIGFSRFLITEAPRILNKPLALPVCCQDGTVVEAEHFIIGDKLEGKWRFAATITPKAEKA
jgi:PAS domain S-box-containing protein